jgi:hypothetical protein
MDSMFQQSVSRSLDYAKKFDKEEIDGWGDGDRDNDSGDGEPIVGSDC